MNNTALIKRDSKPKPPRNNDGYRKHLFKILNSIQERAKIIADKLNIFDAGLTEDQYNRTIKAIEIRCGIPKKQYTGREAM